MERPHTASLRRREEGQVVAAAILPGLPWSSLLMRADESETVIPTLPLILCHRGRGDLPLSLAFFSGSIGDTTPWEESALPSPTLRPTRRRGSPLPLSGALCYNVDDSREG